MSLTITEASHVNTLLDWITGTPGPAGPVTEERAREAAGELAAKAHRALMAGLDRDRLVAAWAMPIGVCSLCPTRVRGGELVEHIRREHPGVWGWTVPAVDVNAEPARAAVSDLRDRTAESTDA